VKKRRKKYSKLKKAAFAFKKLLSLLKSTFRFVDAASPAIPRVHPVENGAQRTSLLTPPLKRG
jgi:hypothetical protein